MAACQKPRKIKQPYSKPSKKPLNPYVDQLSVKEDSEKQFYLETKNPSYKRRPMFFAAVTRKSYISYHLMPLYWKPELLGSISRDLRKRMQGKTCFNSKAMEPELLAELASLTKADTGLGQLIDVRSQDGHLKN